MELEAIDKNNNALTKAGNDLTDLIIAENDPDKLDDLTQLFRMNQKKKDIARVNRLSNMLELIDDEAISRLTNYSDAINNSDLISFMKTAQQAVQTTNQSIEQTPLIQINNTNIETNVNANVSGLSTESRAKVMSVVNSILNNINNEPIDVTPE